MNNGVGMQTSSTAAMPPATLSSPTPLPPSSSTFRSNVVSFPSHLTSTLSLTPLSLPISSSRPASSDHHHAIGAEPIPAVHVAGSEHSGMIGRVRLSDIAPYDGAPGGAYVRAVEALSGSLTRHNAVVIEMGSEDSAIMRCALESVRMYFKARAQCSGSGGSWGKSCRGVYIYRAGRPLEDGDLTPPCMSEAFKCLGKAARAALCTIARHLRLRSDVFNHLLDDSPLPSNEVSSSVLIAAHSHASLDNGKGATGGGKPTMREVEKGLLTLIASDSPGIQVCDPNGRWYLADGGLGPGDLLLVTGRSLSHVTAGLRPAASYRTGVDYCQGISSGGRASLCLRLMPQSNAVLDCSPIAAAGHVIPQSFVPISVSQFMDDLSTEEDAVCNHPDHTYQEARNHLTREPSLRSVLSDPLSGIFLEDAVVISCGHSFGGHMLKKVIETGRCILCDSDIEAGAMIPNYALRAAAAAVKNQDDRRLFHNAALRKRRKEVGEHAETFKRLNKENGDIAADSDNCRQSKGVRYPFTVNEKVIIKGNRRTPDKFVGREAIITSQCLNGWYLLKILDSGESVRLQYRSLQKILSSQGDDMVQAQALIQNNS